MSTPFDNEREPLESLDAELQALAAQTRGEETPVDLHERVMGRVRQAPPPRRRAPAVVLLRWSLPLAAAVVLVVALSRSGDVEKSVPPPAPPVAQAVTLELPSIEISKTLAEGTERLRENTRALAESAAPFLEGTRSLLPDLSANFAEEALDNASRS